MAGIVPAVGAQSRTVRKGRDVQRRGAACEAAARLGWVGSNRFANRPVCAPGDFPVTFLPADRTQSRTTGVPSAVSAAVARLATAGGTIPSRLLSSSNTSKLSMRSPVPGTASNGCGIFSGSPLCHNLNLPFFQARRAGNRNLPNARGLRPPPLPAPGCDLYCWVLGPGAVPAWMSQRRRADGAKRRPPSLLCPLRQASLGSVRPTRLLHCEMPTGWITGFQGVTDES